MAKTPLNGFCVWAYSSCVALTALFSPTGVLASIPEVDGLFARLDRENSENHFAEFNQASSQEGVRAAKAFLYPSLTLNGAASKAKAITVNASDYQSSGGGSLSSSASTLGLPTSYTKSTEGWSGQLSSTYYAFTHFEVSQSIKNAEISKESSDISVKAEKIKRRAQFLQLLLEWQWLKNLVGPLQNAQGVLEKVKAFSQSTSSILYGADETGELEERDRETAYYWIKVSEGLGIVEQALRDMIPSLKLEELQALPTIATEYAFPPEKELRDRFVSQSESRKILENDVRIADGNYFVARWNRPWIPTLLFSASASQYGGYDGTGNGNSWSGQALLSFNLFDGFYTDARRAQSAIALSAVEEKRDWETNKGLLALKAKRMKALVSQSEFKFKEATAKRKQRAYQETEGRFKKGMATHVDLTAASLQYIKAKSDALDALKDYQSATLGIAVDLNEWDRVKILAVTR